MLEKPDLADESISAGLRAAYDLTAASIEFLPLGYDANAGVYRVMADDGTIYFLKVKKGGVAATSLAVPRALRDAGIEQVAAPLPTRSGQLATDVEAFALILYPFIAGGMVMQRGLADARWRELGTVVQQMHAFELPAALAQQLTRETFEPPRTALLREVDARLAGAENGGSGFTDDYQRALAALWREQRGLILTIAARAEAYGRQLRARDLPFVLCHADLHTANVLVNDAGQFFIVDWDGALLAPKERDLMFVTGAGAGAIVAYGQRAADLFFSGYGSTPIDPLALAYYRCDWVVQDVAEFGSTLLFQRDVSAITKTDVLRNLTGIFEPGNTADVAYHSEANGL